MLGAVICLIKIGTNREWFDDHEPMEDDDDDIGDLDDYLIPKDAPYYVDEKEERFKERNNKLIGIPYKKPPTFKSEKLKKVLNANEGSGGVLII
ncbi:hypothetical protein Tco_0435985 [Tanacetum coccineum]